ncbi:MULTISPECIES: ABC transporter permease [Haloferax]|uniref:ABC transporter permease subunit n=1 Tax=Haloferax marinum TaxID=2666143 RepID=A0A6A8G3F8_9EURY|nr:MULTISPECIES: ABC transporter permease [Haloferax]KAB1196703.1 ABC transporter permease [Haloferax sp. CBA1150]MRW95710.1 ABC transporter permease subunit [Haloferax marinum]
MAPDTQSDTGATERFEDVEWDELGGLGFPRRTQALVVATVAYAAAVAYDLFVTDDAVLSGTNWLFVLTLLVGAFFVAWPLAENRRLTAYYWRRFKRNRAAVVSAAYLVVVFVVGTLGPLVLTEPELNILAAYQPPVYLSVDSAVPTTCVGQTADGLCHGTWQYPLGTTSDGKGIAKLVVFGMRVSMQVGLVTMLIVVSIGTAVGTSAAYFSGLVDELLMRYVDIQQTFPTFFLFLIVTYLFKPSLFLLITIFGFLGWGGIARLVRSEALQRREESYIRAAENAGASDGWIIRRHLMPNVSNTVITAATLLIPSFILFEATFAFLGLTDPATPSWGQVIASGRGDLDGAWWIATIPGVFLFFTVLAFNFVGDALRDALDPRSEGDA